MKRYFGGYNKIANLISKLNLIRLIHEEIVAGEKSLSKPFLNEIKTKLLVLPKVRGPVQIVAQCSDRTQGPIQLEGLIQSWGQGWN